MNAGIVQAHRDGILTSTTLLANAPAFEAAVDLARSTPTLAIGVHLNIVRGRPLSATPDVPDLVDADGVFRRFRFRWFGRAFLDQAEREYRAQIERVLAAGIVPDHVDFEKHHAWQRPLYTMADRLAAEYGIPAIRSLQEPVAWAVRRLGWPGWRHAAMAGTLRAGLTVFGGNAGLAHPDYFLGQTHIGRMDEQAWLRLLDRPPAGISEVMTHPGLPDDTDAGDMGTSWLDTARAVELQALIAPAVREKARENGVEWVQFADIDSNAMGSTI